MGFSLLPPSDGNEEKAEARCVRVFAADCCRVLFGPTSTVYVPNFLDLFLTFTIPNFGRGLLRWAALFLGELRDGLTMINMQSAFLIVSKQYSEKQAGVLFFGEFYCALPTVG